MSSPRGIRFVASASIVLLLVLAAGLTPRETHSWTTSVSATVQFQAESLDALTAKVDITPDSLQWSQGPPVTAFVELPAELDLAPIAADNLLLCLESASCGSTDVVRAEKAQVNDADGDGVLELEVQFSRREVLVLVAEVEPPAMVHLVLSGSTGARAFVGSAHVKLVDPGANVRTTPVPSPSPANDLPEDPTPGPSSSPAGSTSSPHVSEASETDP